MEIDDCNDSPSSVPQLFFEILDVFTCGDRLVSFHKGITWIQAHRLELGFDVPHQISYKIGIFHCRSSIPLTE
jgi:hypothetical protein